jgi:glycosyltransferase involved in cell wall biosynthesis
METGLHRNLWVICAAYNEATTIGGVVADLRHAGHQVVVVDDGSRDGTRHIAAAAGATVVAHPVNLGQGAALQTGIDYALSRGAYILVTFDADGQHRVADIPRLLDALRREGADFALGSRFLGQTYNLPTLRESGLRYVEVPVTIEYTAYSLAKGQRIGDSVTILLDLFAQELRR